LKIVGINGELTTLAFVIAVEIMYSSEKHKFSETLAKLKKMIVKKLNKLYKQQSLIKIRW
jgi:hypothetical protein